MPDIAAVSAQCGGDDFIVKCGSGDVRLISDGLVKSALSSHASEFFANSVKNTHLLAVSAARSCSSNALACVSLYCADNESLSYDVCIFRETNPDTVEAHRVSIDSELSFNAESKAYQLSCWFNSLGTQLTIAALAQRDLSSTEYQVLDDTRDIEFDPTLPQQYALDERARAAGAGKTWVRTSHHIFQEALPCMGYTVGDRYLIVLRDVQVGGGVREKESGLETEALLSNTVEGIGKRGRTASGTRLAENVPGHLETHEDGVWRPASYMQEQSHLDHYKTLYGVSTDMQYTKDTFAGFSRHAIYLFEPWQLAYPHEVVPLALGLSGALHTTDVVSLADNLLCRVCDAGGGTSLQFYASSSYIWKLLKEFSLPGFQAYANTARLTAPGVLSILYYCSLGETATGRTPEARDGAKSLAPCRGMACSVDIPFAVSLPLSNYAPVTSRLQDNIVCCHVLSDSTIPPPAYDVGIPFSAEEGVMDVVSVCGVPDSGTSAEATTDIVVLTEKRVLLFSIKRAEDCSEDVSDCFARQDCPEIAGDTGYLLHSQICEAEKTLERQEAMRREKLGRYASQDMEDLGEEWGELVKIPGSGKDETQGGAAPSDYVMSEGLVLDPFGSNYTPAYVPTHSMEEKSSLTLESIISRAGEDPQCFVPIQLGIRSLQSSARSVSDGLRPAATYELFVQVLDLRTKFAREFSLGRYYCPTFVSDSLPDQFSVGSRFETPLYCITMDTCSMIIQSRDSSGRTDISEAVAVEPHSRLLYANEACTRILLWVPRGNLETRSLASTNFAQMYEDFQRIWKEHLRDSTDFGAAEGFFSLFSQKRLWLSELAEATFCSDEETDFGLYVEKFMQLLFQLPPFTFLRLLEALPSLQEGVSPKDARQRFIASFWIRAFTITLSTILQQVLQTAGGSSDFMKALLTLASTASGWMSAVHFGSTNVFAAGWICRECFSQVLIRLLQLKADGRAIKAFSVALKAFEMPLPSIAAQVAFSIGVEQVLALAAAFDITEDALAQAISDVRTEGPPPYVGSGLLAWECMDQITPKTLPTVCLLRVPAFPDVPISPSPFDLSFDREPFLSLGEARSLVGFGDLVLYLRRADSGSVECSAIADAVLALQAHYANRARFLEALIVFLCWFYMLSSLECCLVTTSLLSRLGIYGGTQQNDNATAEFSALALFITGNTPWTKLSSGSRRFRFLADMKRAALLWRERECTANADRGVLDSVTEFLIPMSSDAEESAGEVGITGTSSSLAALFTVLRYTLFQAVSSPGVTVEQFCRCARWVSKTVASQEARLLDALQKRKAKLRESEDALDEQLLKARKAVLFISHTATVGSTEANLTSNVALAKAAVLQGQEDYDCFRVESLDLRLLLAACARQDERNSEETAPSLPLIFHKPFSG